MLESDTKISKLSIVIWESPCNRWLYITESLHLVEPLPILKVFKSCKCNLIGTVLCRGFSICSSIEKFHQEINTLKSLFKTNDYPKNFINLSRSYIKNDLRVTTCVNHNQFSDFHSVYTFIQVVHNEFITFE